MYSYVRDYQEHIHEEGIFMRYDKFSAGYSSTGYKLIKSLFVC